jgi:hypothetical protein
VETKIAVALLIAALMIFPVIARIRQIMNRRGPRD